VSRESLLLVNNVVFLVATLTVLFGTLFPLLMDALGQGKYSVGPPYFNAVFVPLMALLAPFMGIGPLSRWRDDSVPLAQPVAGAGWWRWAVPSRCPGWATASFNIWVALAVLLAAWVVLGLVRICAASARCAFAVAGAAPSDASYWGMVLAHCGFAAVVLGVVATTQYSVERDLKMAPGDSETLAGYRFEFPGDAAPAGPNYLADGARLRSAGGA
jgi:cytochrome c-type biogenesis protein CcmF